YGDEFVRHKILDAVGDLYLAGHAVIGAFEGYKSGHALNNKLVRALLAERSAWEEVTFPEAAAAPPLAYGELLPACAGPAAGRGPVRGVGSLPPGPGVPAIPPRTLLARPVSPALVFAYWKEEAATTRASQGIRYAARPCSQK